AFKQILNPKHGMSKFSVGSIDTLADRPGSDIREELLTFYQQHYSANNMSLVVLGSETIEQLRAMVETKFSDVVKRPMAEDSATVPLFNPGTLPALLKVSSIKEVHELNLSFPVPVVRPYYAEKPLRFLSALLGHEGEGSLLDLLKKRGLARSLSAGPGLNYQDSATLSISIGLTPQGFERYSEVVDLSFQYLRLVEQQGVQPWLYQEEQSISNTAFRFRENSNRVYHLTHLASNLKRYPLAEVIRGDYLYRGFDGDLIKSYLKHLKTDNLLLTLTAKDLPLDQKDPWYGTAYELAAISAAELKQWSQSPIDPELKIPAPNPFLAEDFSLREAIDTPVPAVIKSAPGYKLWFKQDQQFKTPKADFFVTFRSPTANDSARHHVLTNLYIKLVNDKLNSFVYPASVAGQRSSLYPHIRGFSLRLSGFRDKQHRLLEEITNNLINLEVDPKRLAIFKQELKRQLQNSRKEKPYNQALEEVYLRVMNPQWSSEQQLLEVDSITPKELQTFMADLLSRGNIEALAHGDINRADALKLSAIIEQQLLKPVTPSEVSPGQVRLLSDSAEVKDLTIDHNDSAISTYIQGADKALKTRANYALLGKILSPPFYTQLRTEKQLGYIVFASSMPILEHPGLAMVIQSPSAHPDQLQQHIDSFIESSLPLIESLDAKSLEEYKQGILVELLKKDQNLTDRTSRYWREIDRNYLDFNSREQLAKAIETVQVEDLIETFKSLNQRKLVVRSAGQALSRGLTLPADRG
ncbi:MAG: insulinase family protein, partial [Motiliproteus sp.]|nr:insulinase family protein [Motiliproteus sp.]